MVVERQTQLLEVVGTTHPRGRLADLLYGRQEQPDQDRDDGDDDQELDECECTMALHGVLNSLM